MTPPKRIRLSRAKGSRMPYGAISVARPSRWGNKYVIGKPAPSPFGFEPVEPIEGWEPGPPLTRAQAVDRHRQDTVYSSKVRAELVAQLRGHDLACWCKLDELCHADTLLELANVGALPDLPWIARWGTMLALVEAPTFTSAWKLAKRRFPGFPAYKGRLGDVHGTLRAATPVEVAAIREVEETAEAIAAARTPAQKLAAAAGYRPPAPVDFDEPELFPA